MTKRFFILYYDRLLVGFALVALIVSVGWFWQAQGEVRRIRAQPVAVRLSNSAYQPVVLRPAAPASERWAKPTAQAAGAGWVYELFTPPVVFYHQKSATFTVIPPLDSTETNAPFTLELVSVKRELYRLQLAGYFGEPGAYTVVFTNPNAPGTVRAREGERLVDLGVLIKQFSVTRVALERQGASTGFEVAAQVELLDKHTGAAVMLDSRSQKFTEAPVALVRFSASTGSSNRAVREGEEFSDRGYIYRIERINPVPAEVTVTRTQPGVALSETKILHPSIDTSAPRKALAQDSTHSLPRLATGLVTKEK